MKNFWAEHCKNFVFGENCMDSEEEHHPGRLAGPTERIPKLVHDIIHQDERNAVKGIFELDGITGFNPGRWTGKKIPEESTIPLLNFDSFKWMEDLKEKRQKDEEQKQKMTEIMEATSEFLKNFGINKNEKKEKNVIFTGSLKFNQENFSSFPKTNFTVNVPSYSEVFIPTLPSFQPAFCLGGSMDSEAMERRSIPYGNSHPLVANAPNGYGGGPVLFTPSGGWQPV